MYVMGTCDGVMFKNLNFSPHIPLSKSHCKMTCILLVFRDLKPIGRCINPIRAKTCKTYDTLLIFREFLNQTIISNNSFSHYTLFSCNIFLTIVLQNF